MDVAYASCRVAIDNTTRFLLRLHCFKSLGERYQIDSPRLLSNLRWWYWTQIDLLQFLIITNYTVLRRDTPGKNLNLPLRVTIIKPTGWIGCTLVALP